MVCWNSGTGFANVGIPVARKPLFRVMRKLGMFPQPKAKAPYKAKPYEQMQYPGQRVQADVKVVPLKCLANPEERLYQYTAIDEYTRLRYLGAYPEQSTYSSADFWRKWWPGSNAVACG